jgi:mRNA interferase MazF
MNPPTKIYNQFDVVVVPFPFTDSGTTKRRPALILSDAGTFNTQMQKGVMAMITTVTHKHWALDIVISDLSLTGLNAASLIRMKLFTLDYSLIVRRIGHLGGTDSDEVMNSISQLFNITSRSNSDE